MSPKKQIERKKRVQQIQKVLKQLYPKAHIALNYSNEWELLVAVMLSAQCTDKMVNTVTQTLFKKYTTLKDYTKAKQSVFEKDIRSTGFYRNKAKNILATAQKIQGEFGGKVPRTMEELTSLPGVARKTANVVLSNAFGINTGIAVDTHVRRFVIRFDLSDYKDPVRIEKELMEIVPQKEWNTITYGLIEYGRSVCPARKHDCREHPLTKVYPQANAIWPTAH